MKQILLIFAIAFTLVSYSQDVVYGEEVGENPTEEKSIGILDYQNRLFLGISSTFFIDFITGPLTEGEIITKKVILNIPTDVSEKTAEQTAYQSFYSIGITPRYNLQELSDKAAIAVSAPLSIGFGNSGAANSDVNGAQGFGNFQLPLLLHLYYGAEATNRSDEDFGLNIGAGLELNKIGIFNFGTVGTEQPNNKAWIMPSIQAGAQFYRGYSPVEVSIKYGFGQLQEQFVDQYGNRLLDGKKVTRASSLKLSITYLL
jgi:hypothetical protein